MADVARNVIKGAKLSTILEEPEPAPEAKAMVKDLMCRAAQNRFAVAAIVFVVVVLLLLIVRPPMALENETLSLRKTVLWATLATGSVVVMMLVMK